MKQTVIVNISQMSEAGLEAALADRLRRLLGTVAWLKGWQVERRPAGRGAPVDILATLPLPAGGKAKLLVECRQELRPSLFRTFTEKTSTLSSGSGTCVRVLGMPFVSPRIRELCVAEHWSWFDLAGNCHLDVPGLLRVEHAGNEAVHRTPRPRANLGTPEAGRILRALLAPEHAGKLWTQRVMQTECMPSVSIGLVNKVVRHLCEEAFADEGPERGFRLRNPRSLLEAWNEAYRFDRHRRRGYFTLLQGNALHHALSELGSRTKGFAVYAAFSAADIQAPDVRQPKTWLYVREAELGHFESMLEAKPVDVGENLVVLIPQDEGVFYRSDPGHSPTGGRRLPCTNLVQTYLDLSHCGGRGKEAAETVLDLGLKPSWQAKGLPT